MRWYEFVRKMLGSEEVRKIVKEMSSGKDVVLLNLECVYCWMSVCEGDPGR